MRQITFLCPTVSEQSVHRRHKEHSPSFRPTDGALHCVAPSSAMQALQRVIRTDNESAADWMPASISSLPVLTPSPVATMRSRYALVCRIETTPRSLRAS